MTTKLKRIQLFSQLSDPLTEMDLLGWLGQAEPGDQLEYHRGFLAIDTSALMSRLAVPERVQLAKMADRALWAAESGLVHLVQRRRAENEFSYLAIARTRPKVASLSSMLLEAA